MTGTRLTIFPQRRAESFQYYRARYPWPGCRQASRFEMSLTSPPYFIVFQTWGYRQFISQAFTANDQPWVPRVFFKLRSKKKDQVLNPALNMHIGVIPYLESNGGKVNPLARTTCQ